MPWRTWGCSTRRAACSAICAERVAPTCDPEQDRSFESWIVSRFGRRLFDMFFKSYSEKLWGISCQDLDADFAAQRIKKFSLGQAIKTAIFPGKQNAHATLVDRFAYPIAGTGSVYERMADRVRALGGEIRLKSPVRRVVRDGFEVRGLELVDGQVEACDHVISTMPLTLLVRGLGDIPPEVQRLGRQPAFPQHGARLFARRRQRPVSRSMGLHPFPRFADGRLTNFRNWVPELYGEHQTSILAAEYWCYENDALWTESDDKIIADASAELRSTGLLGDAKIWPDTSCASALLSGLRARLSRACRARD